MDCQYQLQSTITKVVMGKSYRKDCRSKQRCGAKFSYKYYLNGILEAFKTGELTIKDKYSFEVKPINNQNQWNNLVETLLTNAERLIVAVSQMNDEILNSDFFDKKYGTYHRNIEGVIEHSYYHLGQIALINKLLTK